MAVQVFEVAYSTDDVTYTALSNVVSINIKLGREHLTDNPVAGSGTVVIRYPTGFASPISAMVSGTYIRIKNTTTNRIQWTGKINDVEVAYDIPYVGGVGNGDYLTLHLEGALAVYARSNGNNYVMASDYVDIQASAASAANGGSMYRYLENVVMQGSTVSGSWGDWLNKTNASINGRLFDYGKNIYWTGKYYINPSSINFSDTTNNATNQVYDKITFESLGYNYYTQVTVTPDGGTAQVVSSGLAPYRNYALATFNNTSGQALDYANYLLNTYKTPVSAISSVSCFANAQNSMQLDNMGTIAAMFWASISTRVAITFRGTTTYGVIEGVALSATPDAARYTFYFSPADLNAYLILNDAVFGRLDYNKLGY
jgi:hypothetical protein